MTLEHWGRGAGLVDGTGTGTGGTDGTVASSGVGEPWLISSNATNTSSTGMRTPGRCILLITIFLRS